MNVTYANILPYLFTAMSFFLILFVLLYNLHPFKLLNGLVFDIFYVLILIFFYISFFSQSNAVVSSIFFLLLIIGVISPISMMILFMLFLLINGIRNLKKEGLSLSNSLSLLLFIFINAEIIICGFVLNDSSHLQTLAYILTGIISLQVPLLFEAFSYFTITVLNLIRPVYGKKDYIIVLGAGLINGNEITPLLQNRVKRAAYYYKKRINKRGGPPILIMSGGQGSNETISEGEAMKAAAIEMGIPENAIIVEDKSTSTYENIRNSKMIMDSRSKKYKSLVCTCDFHVLRAGAIADSAGLKVRTIWSRTPFYFSLNAHIREFTALLVKNKKSTIILCGISLASYIIFAIIN
jgi:uncharacterized SAM-binding protein YcdF (DUF218 family)